MLTICNIVILSTALFAGVACSRVSPSDADAAASDAAVTASFSTFQKMVGSPAYTASLASVASSSWSGVWQHVQTSGGAGANIAGYALNGAATKKFAAGYQMMDSLYGSVGKYWTSAGFDPHAAISAQQFGDGLNTYERVLSAWGSSQDLSLTAAESLDLARLQVISMALSLAKPEAKGLALAATAQGGEYVPPAPIIVINCVDVQLPEDKSWVRIGSHREIEYACAWKPAGAKDQSGESTEVESSPETDKNQVTNQEQQSGASSSSTYLSPGSLSSSEYYRENDEADYTMSAPASTTW